MRTAARILIVMVLISHVSNGVYITGVTIEDVSTVYNNATEGPYYAEKLIGMDHVTGLNTNTGLHIYGPDTHSTISANTYAQGQKGTMWMTVVGDRNPYILFDLGALYNLDFVRIWNWNNPAVIERGVKDLDIYVSDIPRGPNDPGWTLAASVTLDLGPGSNTTPFGQTFNLSQEDNVRYVKFDIQSCYNSIDLYGLSEVRFAAEPQSSIPLAYQQDGFTMFGQHAPPMSVAELEGTYVDPFENTNAGILLWGLGPGSVFTFNIDPAIEKIFGEGLTEEDWATMREVDRWIHDTVMNFIDNGKGPLEVAVERSHELNLKLFAHLAMNHVYNSDSWEWVGFVGDFNKSHPEYRLPGFVRLDYKYPAVRDYKLAILRDAVEKGCDGVQIDFSVWPPYLSDPYNDYPYLTQFIRDVRQMLDDVGSSLGHSMKLMIRLDFDQWTSVYGYLGYDWKTWLDEGLVDYIVPYLVVRSKDRFTLPIDEFVDYRNQIGSQAKIYGCIGHGLGFVDTDLQPDGTRGYDRPHTERMYYAQALTYHRSGADGIELAMSHDQWVSMPWQNDLANFNYLEFADKEYMVDYGPYLPVEFGPVSAGQSHHDEQTVKLTIADNIEKAKRIGIQDGANVVIYFNRPLEDNEEIGIYINGYGPVVANSRTETNPIPYPELDPHSPDSWKIGKQVLNIDMNWLRMGDNSIRLVYDVTPGVAVDKESIRWIDVNLNYKQFPAKNSDLFEHKYEMDVDPDSTPDWDWFGDGTHEVSDGIYILDSVPKTSYIQNSGNAWSDHATGSWTVEFSYKVVSVYGTADYAFAAVAGGAAGGAICRFGADTITFGSSEEVISQDNNTDSFHTVRIAYDNKSDKVFVWRDGALLLDDGTLTAGSYYTRKLELGDSVLFTTYQGRVEYDFYRFTTAGIFAPDLGSCAEIWQAGLGIVQDLSRDCYIDLTDLAMFSQGWLKCNNPADAACTQ